MSKNRFVGANIFKKSQGLTILEAKNGKFYASAFSENKWNGGDDGIKEYDYETGKNDLGEATVIDAYFARIKGNVYERINWAGVEDEIYVVIKTIGLKSRDIELNIIDRDAVISGNKYGAISPLHDNQDKKGLYSTKIRDDGYAILKIEMKPSNDVKEIKLWRDKIDATKDKRAYLCLLVSADKSNPDLKISYLGTNPENDQASEKAKKANYWLDTKGDWFQLRKKNPVIVIDPGHGYTKGNTGAVSWIYTYKLKGKDGKDILDAKKNAITAKSNVIELPQYVIDDPTQYVISTKEDTQRSERFLVYDVSAVLKTILENKGYKVFITRERGPIEGSDNGTTRKLRIDLAKNNKADYFISIHADGVNGYTSTGSHVIYPSSDNAECIELASDIFSSYNVVAVEAESPKIDIRGLQVLSQKENTTKRKVLVELGFVTTPKDAKSLFLNTDLIARQLSQGLEVNINKNF
jgi:N-acetylmuramoyl-L-alanine amidase